ncbi:hypothetical protein GQ600_14100 [Phytophthora cactorum]|nr:hypothetical protein GQ600_14100 [Phytophthora cactorum]
MLARMVYWHRLDNTPWAAYVPEAYFHMAEVVLDSYVSRDIQPVEWPQLQFVQDAEIVEALEDDSEESDNSRDESYRDENERPPVKPSKCKSPSGSKHGSPSKSQKTNNKQSTPRRSARSRPAFSSDNSSEQGGGTRDCRCGATSCRDPGQDSRACPDGYCDSSIYPDPQEVQRLDLQRALRRRGSRSWDLYTESLRGRGSLHSHAPHISSDTWFRRLRAQKNDTWILVERWHESSYPAICDSEPWKEMLPKRPRVLYFHVRDSLSPTVLRILDEMVKFMHDNARSFWEIVHCLTVKTQGQTPEETASLSSSVQLYMERSKLHESVVRTYWKMRKRILTRGCPESFFDEPGV